jgi:DNA-binding CsgD family transcriptional regulator
MTMLAKETLPALRAAVRLTERVCALPAVATQDWCDRAAAALLPVDQPSIAVVLIGQVDEHGVIIRTEATGVAGCVGAEVTTTVGRAPSSSTAMVALDPNDSGLMRVRTSLAQARELSWGPGSLAVGAARVTVVDRTHPTASAPAGLLRRWEGVRFSGILLGATGIGHDRRLLVAEVALSGSSHNGLLESDALAMEAVLPSLSRRAIMAIGLEATDDTVWLTQREQIILQHLLLGKSVREIAQELGRSPHTVHDHVKSLHRKLNASSRGELVARALGHVEPPHANVQTRVGQTPAVRSPSHQ